MFKEQKAPRINVSKIRIREMKNFKFLTSRSQDATMDKGKIRVVRITNGRDNTSTPTKYSNPNFSAITSRFINWKPVVSKEKRIAKRTVIQNTVPVTQSPTYRVFMEDTLLSTMAIKKDPRTGRKMIRERRGISAKIIFIST